eukprot:gene2847-4690_t
MNSFLVQTYFNPDEYWQSLEVAHRMSFGYGYLTWEWKEGIRGIFYPFIYFIIFECLKIFHLDYSYLLIRVPMLFQSIFSFLTDYFTYKLSFKLFKNEQISNLVLLCSLLNWFNFYCGVRTLSNSMESTLTIIGLNFEENENWIYFAGLSCLFRPTNSVVWLFYFIFRFKYTNDILKLIKKLIYNFIFFISFSILMDSLFYQRFIFIIFNFLKFNLSGKANIYGTHSIHWYFSNGLPTMLFTYIPLLFIGIYFMNKTSLKDIQYLLISILTILIYSILSEHKEFRFIYSILPILIIYSGYGLYKLLFKSSFKYIIFLFIFIPQILLGGYFSLIHQRGSLDVMNILRNKNNVKNIYFLIPCHHTPGYSHLHKNISLKFLDCSPNNLESTHLDESDSFHLNKIKFTNDLLKDNNVLPPSHIVIYEDLKFLKYLKNKWKYKLINRIFHSHLSKRMDSRTSNYFLILEK